MIETVFKESNVFFPFLAKLKYLGFRQFGASLCWLYIATAGAVHLRDTCLHLVVRKNSLVFPRLDFLGRQ